MKTETITLVDYEKLFHYYLLKEGVWEFFCQYFIHYKRKIYLDSKDKTNQEIIREYFELIPPHDWLIQAFNWAAYNNDTNGKPISWLTKHFRWSTFINIIESEKLNLNQTVRFIRVYEFHIDN